MTNEPPRFGKRPSRKTVHLMEEELTQVHTHLVRLALCGLPGPWEEPVGTVYDDQHCAHCDVAYRSQRPIQVLRIDGPSLTTSSLYPAVVFDLVGRRGTGGPPPAIPDPDDTDAVL